MRNTTKAIIITLAVLTIGCTGKGPLPSGKNAGRDRDTLHTLQAAMSIYAYQPVRALQIIDSAVIVDNLNDVRADIARARIYSSSLRKDELDSMLGGPAGIRFDTARAIGERVLRHDSVKVDLKKQKSILEILTYVARMQEDTTRWMLRAGELLNVCHQLGAGSETDALRTEAEIGAAFYVMGQQEQGMAKLDSAIFQLESSFIGEDKKGAFNELDALIVALKRKISVLSKNDKYAETLPLARSIIERLADYEQHPDDYHDDSPREPKDATQRIDYIEFYRNQAQNFITAAYTALSEDGSMIATFEDIERKVLDATTREHLARYNALEQRMKAEHHQLEAKLQQDKTNKAILTAVAIGIIALLAVAFAAFVIVKNRTISRKNRLLAQQIADALNYKELYRQERQVQTPAATPPDINTLSDEQLFKHINDVIMSERLFLDPKFERQTIMDRFQLSKERVGAIFSKFSDHAKLNSYILQLRLEHAAMLLVEKPDLNIVQVATDSGFSSGTYFSDRFRQHFGMSPTDYRKAHQSAKKP